MYLVSEGLTTVGAGEAPVLVVAHDVSLEVTLVPVAAVAAVMRAGQRRGLLVVDRLMLVQQRRLAEHLPTHFTLVASTQKKHTLHW